MKKKYFIDSENVGDSWVALLDTTTDEDEILVFYTAKSPFMPYKSLITLKESPREVTFVECREGNNALDFQLSTELGFHIHGDSDSEFVIVSNDNGYNAVVEYWEAKNIPVRRIRGNDCQKIKSQISTPECGEPESGEQAMPAIDNVDLKASELLYIVGKENLVLLHESLKQIFGPEQGKIYYNAFKSDPSYSEKHKNRRKLSLAERQQYYIELIFVSADVQIPKDFPEYAMGAWAKKANLNSLKSTLQEKYGKEDGEKYYSVIKPHIKLLGKLK